MAFPLLGTAQLGMPYGIANLTGKPDRETAFAILEAAVEEGITAFDTAAAYGDSEAILGSFIEAHGLASSIGIVTKVKAHAPDEIDRAIDSSLRRLRVSKLSVLLLHSMPDRESLFDIVERLAERVDDGQVDSVGISVYETEDALDVLRTSRLSITQVPTNLFDHRFIEAGVFDAGIRERKR
ncbi:MAG: aldo/keto reductase, partial [Acidobacteria bacterium]|nr:aldo/keto reductase [Acidobacteriota bacterium]